MQPQLLAEAEWLAHVYNTALYGGDTLNDSYIDQAKVRRPTGMSNLWRIL